MSIGWAVRRSTFVVPVLLLTSALRVGRAEEGAGYEQPAPAAASQVLAPELLAGPHHRVRPTATPDDFLYRFEMESDYGLFPVTGKRLLSVRVKEVETIGRLLAMDVNGEFMKSLSGRLSAMPTAAIELVSDPLGSVEAMGKGVGRTLGRVGDMFGRRKPAAGESSGIDDALFAQEKRKLAYELDVDPYSTNPRLQTLLTEVARARGAGRLVVDAAASAIPGPGGTALSVVKMRDDVKGLLRDRTPAELDRLNDAKLERRGVAPYLRRQFAAQRHLSPTHRTLIAAAVERLDGVADAGPLVAACLTAEDETSALVRVQQAALLASHQLTVEPLRRLDVVGGLVVAFTASGRVVIYVPVDVIAWTEATEQAARAVAAIEGVSGAPSRSLLLTGGITPKAEKALGLLGFDVRAGVSAP